MMTISKHFINAMEVLQVYSHCRAFLFAKNSILLYEKLQCVQCFRNKHLNSFLATGSNSKLDI